MPEGTRIELLYCDGCPSHTPAGEFLCEALAEVGLEAEVELVAVNTDDEARRLRFPDSPTIRLDGEDLFPAIDAHERKGWRLGCRVYATPEGSRAIRLPT